MEIRALRARISIQISSFFQLRAHVTSALGFFTFGFFHFWVFSLFGFFHFWVFSLLGFFTLGFFTIGFFHCWVFSLLGFSGVCLKENAPVLCFVYPAEKSEG